MATNKILSDIVAINNINYKVTDCITYREQLSRPAYSRSYVPNQRRRIVYHTRQVTPAQSEHSRNALRNTHGKAPAYKNQ